MSRSNKLAFRKVKMSSMKNIVAVLLLGMALSGCASTPEDPEKPGFKDSLRQMVGLPVSGEEQAVSQDEMNDLSREMQGDGRSHDERVQE